MKKLFLCFLFIFFLVSCNNEADDIIYTYNEANDCYEVTSFKYYNYQDLTIKSNYNDNIHGEKEVKAVIINYDITIEGELYFPDTIEAITGRGHFTEMDNIRMSSNIEKLDSEIFYYGTVTSICNCYDDIYYIGNEEYPYLVGSYFKNTPGEYKYNEATRIISRAGTLVDMGFGGINKVIIPEGVIAICEETFMNIKMEEITIPSSVKRIDSSAFFQSYTKKINFNEGLEYIAPSAFMDIACEELYLPNSVKYIGQGAFLTQFTTTLKKASIPNSLEVLNGNPFRPFNPSLIELRENNGSIIKNNIGIVDIAKNKLLVGYDYITSLEGISTIGAFAFYGVKLTSLKIPKNTVIEKDAFYLVTIDEVIYDDEITDITSYQFSNLTYESKANFILPKNLRSIGNYVFGIVSEANITITTENNVLFKNSFNSNTINIYFSPEVKNINITIDSYMDLKSIHLHSGINTIIDDAFRTKCKSLYIDSVEILKILSNDDFKAGALFLSDNIYIKHDINNYKINKLNNYKLTSVVNIDGIEYDKYDLKKEE